MKVHKEEQKDFCICSKPEPLGRTYIDWTSGGIGAKHLDAICKKCGKRIDEKKISN
jgi:hypothetical protein